MTKHLCLAVIVSAALASGAAAQTAPYYPDRFDWQKHTPQQEGFDAARLDEAIKFAIASDNPAPHDQAVVHQQSFAANEPFDAPLGPHSVRAPLNGIIIHRGYVVAEWGETRKIDMTHSVTKTFLTTVVGLAWQKGLIHDITDKARDYMPWGVDLFDAPHNQNITWEHLLRQTSDWSGTLWGKPDWGDRPVGKPSEWQNRPMYEPGTHFKYNDVRVNVMALAALQVWRRPLPDVLRDEIMEPIGASNTWRWFGYENSWVDIDGKKVQSVPGGGHWGGGMFINAWDMARFGYLFLRNGKWKDRQIVSEKWIQMAKTPGPANKDYGFANWYLNTDRKPMPSLPASSVRFVGAGNNVIYIDWDNDLVVVVRWIKDDASQNEFFGKVIAAMNKPVSTR
jgi:CubicO group peptidase (beta-lactamase class C family)